MIIGNNKNNIGAKNDYVNIPFVPNSETVLAYLQTGYYHVHGASFVFPDKANPVQLTSAVASWAETGNIIEVIPANAITKEFDLHWCKISAISANLYGVIDIFAGSIGNEVKIGAIPCSRTDNFSSETFAPVQVPQQLANTRISCRFTDSTTSARTVNVKFCGHVYSTSLT